MTMLAVLMLAGCSTGQKNTNQYTVTYKLCEDCVGTLSTETYTLETGSSIGENIPNVSFSEEELNEGWYFEGFYFDGKLMTGLDLANVVLSQSAEIEIRTNQGRKFEDFEGIYFSFADNKTLSEIRDQSTITNVVIRGENGGDIDVGFKNDDAVAFILDVIYNRNKTSIYEAHYRKRLLETEDYGKDYFITDHFTIKFIHPHDDAPQRNASTSYSFYTYYDGVTLNYWNAIVAGDYIFMISDEEFNTINEYVKNELYTLNN